ncbi:hypothetical protein RB595_001080 [Gaeumannomyces hyphopodioides]
MVSETPKKTGGRAAATPKDDSKLTEREIEILSKAWACMRNQPEIDMNKLAEALGMTNVGSATNAWGRIKKKLFSGIPAAATTVITTTRKRKSPAKAAADDGGDDDDLANEDTPSKKPRKAAPGRPRKARAGPVKVKNDTGGDDAAAGADEDNGEVKDEPKPEEDEGQKKPVKGSAGFKALNQEPDMSGLA